MNATCSHFVETATDVSYTAFFNVILQQSDQRDQEIISVDFNEDAGAFSPDMDEVLEEACQSVKNETESVIANVMSNLGRADTLCVILKTDNNKTEAFADDKIRLYVNVKLTYRRTELENKLLKMAKSGMAFQRSDLTYTIKHVVPIHRLETNDHINDITIANTLVCPLIEVWRMGKVVDTNNVEVYTEDGSAPVKLSASSVIFSRADKTTQVCFDDYANAVRKRTRNRIAQSDSDITSIYYIFSFCVNALSMFCLCLTIVAYGLLKTLNRTLPGKNTLVLSSCLLAAQAGLQYSSSVNLTDKPYRCIALGLALHYSWLATFCSMNVCSFHMYYVFFHKPLVVTDLTNAKMFNKYVSYVFGIPFAIVGIVVGANAIVTGGARFGYGSGRCFLDSVFSIAFGFIFPASIIFIANFLFYAATFYKLHKSPNVRSNRENRQNLVVYAKLCSITGLAWPLQLVDAVFDLSVFSFVATSVNALQGVFIFFSFVCNRRVCEMLATQLTGGEPSDSEVKGTHTRSSKLGPRSIQQKFED